MDITINTEIGLLALISFILGIYFHQFKPYFHAWVDGLPNDPNNVWKRIQNSGTEDFAPYVKETTLFAAKVVAPYAFLSGALLLILSPFGYFQLAEDIVHRLNYFVAIPALIVLFTCVRQALFFEMKKRNVMSGKG